MEFKKYQHLERLGTEEVEGIELGECYVFPKIDGTNSQLWWDNGLKAGSRNRELALDNDNAGFYNEMIKNGDIKEFFERNPELRLVGEWLVPHSLKTYRQDAWRKFYVFDVVLVKENTDLVYYLSYDEYKPLLEEFNIDYIPCIKKVTNGTYEDFVNIMKQNNYLIEDGQGIGEGIVIKRYGYVNKFGRTTWAKMVTSEFKEVHTKLMGSPSLERELIEQKIVEKYITLAFVDKVYAKMTLNEGWSSKRIPELLNTVYHELVVEESWNFVKEFKHPIVNFKTLNHFTITKVKELKKELFS